jgi:hypothetical protein
MRSLHVADISVPRSQQRQSLVQQSAPTDIGTFVAVVIDVSISVDEL